MVASQSDTLAVTSGVVSPMVESTLSIKQILACYYPYLAGCRAAIAIDLAAAPMGGILTEYFERGKMLRPLLLFAATSAVGGNLTAVIPAAHALELLHGASLIHDDIIDRSKERRCGLSLHLRVGVGPAIVLGDYLILRSQILLAQMKSARALEAMQVLNRCAEDCCRGQVEELVTARENTEDGYFSIIRRKTASPFVAAATVGGILGDGREHEIEALKTYALNLGICFQIRDDELDLTDDASPQKALDRATLPFIYLQNHGSSGASRKYRQLQKGGANRSELLTFLCAEGVIDRLETVKQFHLRQALEAGQCFRNSAEMSAIAQHAINREA